MDEVSRLTPWRQHLDWVVVAGLQPEQIDGLSGSLERLSPAGIAFAVSDTNDKVAAIKGNVARLGIPVTDLQPADVFELGENAWLEVISLGTRGAVLLLRNGHFEALLPLGLDFDQLASLSFRNELGPVDLMLLADSGYRPLNPPAWIWNLSPMMVWSASNEEPIDQELLKAIGESRVYLTDQNGWLRITTDGEQMWFRVEHR